VEAPQEETGLKTRLRHQQVKELRTQGWPILRIAKHLPIHRQTVKKYTQLEKVPKRRPHPNARYRHSLTKEQTLYLAKRWQEGNTKPRQIWRELKEQGYKGVASCIYRAIAYLPARVVTPTVEPTTIDQKAATRAQRPLSARSAVWLLIKPKEELSHKSQQVLSILLHEHEQAKQAYPLAQQFIQMIKDRKADQLDDWIREATQTDIAQLKRFTAGLQRDYQAVKAGLLMEWSNGQVEGQINRLKLIKRQAYYASTCTNLRFLGFLNADKNAQL
jgi:transposase